MLDCSLNVRLLPSALKSKEQIRAHTLDEHAGPSWRELLHMLTNIISQSFQVTAAYDFHRQEPGELEFCQGDVITVTEWLDRNWWRGTVNGRSGVFPSNHVNVPADISQKMRLPGQ